MAYGDPGQSFSDVMLAARQNKEQQFFGNLLQHGIASGGNFNIVNDKPVYSAGTPLPDKTQLWNEFLSMKGNRITAADVQNFESQYTQVSAMRNQKQLQELNKLRAKGYSDKKIQDAVANNEVLYENLLDLTTQLASSGDPEAIQQAMQMEQYMPQKDKGGYLFGGDVDPRDASLTTIGLGATALAGKYAYDKFGNPTKLTADQKKDYRQKLRDAKKPNTEARIKAENEMKGNKKTLKTKSQEIKDKAKKLKQPNKSKPLQKLKAEESELKKKNSKLKKDVKGYRDANKKISQGKVIPKPQSYMGKNKYKFKGGPSPFQSIVASMVAPELGKGVGGFVGGDKGAEIGGQVGGVGVDAALLGSGLMQLIGSKGKKGWTTAGLGGYGLGSRAYNYLTGEK